MKKITVHMTKEALYDFLLFHAYSKFTGFMVNILGLAVAFMGIILYVTDRTGTMNLILYLAAAFLFLGYTPIQLKRRAAKQIKVNPEYAKAADYEFSEDGIKVVQEERSVSYPWEEIKKAVVTPKTIGIYYEDERAMIIPKEDFGEEFVSIFQMIAMHLGTSRIRMR